MNWWWNRIPKDRSEADIDFFLIDMELKKLHMGTISYSLDTMDEIETHLASSFEQDSGNKKKKGLVLRNGLGGFLKKKNYINTFNLGVVGVSGKGRRNIASRVRDIVQALALCHNVSRK